MKKLFLTYLSMMIISGPVLASEPIFTQNLGNNITVEEFSALQMSKANNEKVPLPCSCPCVDEQVLCQEHMFCDKCAQSNKVTITNHRNIVCKGNVLKILFDKPFRSECSKAGDSLTFTIPESVYTQEGTLIIPACSTVNAKIIKIKKQRVPNKNARVYLRFDSIVFPDGCTYVLEANPCTKDGSLKEGPWMTFAKITGWTLGLGAIGAGAGVGFAFIPTVTKIGAGLAIGIPVGASVGLLTGLITPGLKYHAKAGEQIKIILCDDLSLRRISD